MSDIENHVTLIGEPNSRPPRKRSLETPREIPSSMTLAEIPSLDPDAVGNHGQQPQQHEIKEAPDSSKVEIGNLERQQPQGGHPKRGDGEEWRSGDGDGEASKLGLDLGEDDPLPVLIAEDDEYEYPDGGYGWVVLGCCMTLAGTTMGFGLTWGVFQAYYKEQVFPNEGSSVLSLIGSVNGLLLNGTSFISGRVADRYGFKRCLLVSSFVAWLALFLAAFSTTTWQIMLTQGVLSGFGFGIGVPVFFSLPSQWFKKKRGLASGLAVGGAGFGGCISALIARQMLADLGIKYTLLIFSFINLALMLTATALIRTRPDSPEARAKGRGPWLDKRVLHLHAFRWIGLAFFLNPFGYITVVYFLQQYVESVLKPSTAALAALPLSINSLSGGIGRALCGFAADRFGALNTLVMVCLLSGLFVLSVWMTADSYGAVMAFGILYGLIAPTYVSIVPLVARAIFGPTNLASNVGICLLITSPGNLAGAPIGGQIMQSTGQWKWLIAWAGIIQLVAGLIALVGKMVVNRKPWVKL